LYLQRAIREASSYTQCLTKVNVFVLIFLHLLTIES